MIIEEITEQEFLEVMALRRRGWDQCTRDEKKRWVELLAKARLAYSKRCVLSEIIMTKIIKEEDND